MPDIGTKVRYVQADHDKCLIYPATVKCCHGSDCVTLTFQRAGMCEARFIRPPIKEVEGELTQTHWWEPAHA